MGVNDLLPHLPGGKSFRHSFYGLGLTGRVVSLEHLLVMELIYKPTGQIEGGHDLGILVGLK